MLLRARTECNISFNGVSFRGAFAVAKVYCIAVVGILKVAFIALKGRQKTLDSKECTLRPLHVLQRTDQDLIESWLNIIHNYLGVLHS